MKKILLALFLVFASMGVTRLSAYCFYNRSKNPKDVITVFIYSKKGLFGVLGTQKTRHVLKPNPNPEESKDRKCWNWKEIAKKYGGNKNKEWFFRAYKGKKSKADGAFIFGLKAQGDFPIGGAVSLRMYKNGEVKFSVYYDGKPWKKGQ